MNKAEQFQEKYGFSASKLMEDIDVKFLGMLKQFDFNTIVKDEVEAITDGKVVADNEFFALLVEALAEEDIRLPQNQKLFIEDGTELEVSNDVSSLPKSKGVLEDFKAIVSTDDIRPNMQGVYVTDDRSLVATDAHILVKYQGANDFTNNYKKRIINLKNYIASKGKRIDFIDYEYPNYDGVIPKDNSIKKKVSVYALYNLAKSANFLKKYLSNNVFSLQLTIDNQTFYLSPILLADLCGFWLAKGETQCEFQFEAPNRAIVLSFADGNLGLIMPVMSSGLISTIPYDIEKIESQFGGGKAKKTPTKKTSIAKKDTSSREQEPFKKFEGDFKSDSVYISRRDIDQVILKSGEVLYSNDIVDGVYRVKTKKMSMGGVAQSFGSPMIASGMQTVTGNWGGSPVSVFENGGGVGFIPMELEEKLALLSKWGGTNIRGVIGLLNAMIDTGITDEDLKYVVAKKETRLRREKAIEIKIDEIWRRIQPKYNQELKGNMYYSTLKELISRNYIYENLLQKFKPFRKNQKFAQGGQIPSIGDSGIITDKNSMFVGKMALIMGDLGNMFEVRVGERTTMIKKNGIRVVSDEYAKGGLTEHGLKINDKIVSGKIIGTTILVRNENLDEDARIDLNTGKRTLLTYDSKLKKWVEKMAKGGQPKVNRSQKVKYTKK
jgi:hypothetical protein